MLKYFQLRKYMNETKDDTSKELKDDLDKMKDELDKTRDELDKTKDGFDDDGSSDDGSGNIKNIKKYRIYCLNIFN